MWGYTCRKGGVINIKQDGNKAILEERLAHTESSYISAVIIARANISELEPSANRSDNPNRRASDPIPYG